MHQYHSAFNNPSKDSHLSIEYVTIPPSSNSRSCLSYSCQTSTYNNMQDTIVLYAAPGMGHLVPMVELGKLILHRYTHKFSINILITTACFLDTPSLDTYIHQISQSNPSISFHRLPHLTIDNTPTRSPLAMVFEFIRLNAPYVQKMLLELSKTVIIRAFIADHFCASAHPIATSLHIPLYYFLPSGAAALAFCLYFPKIHEETSKSFKDLIETELHFPGLPPLKAIHMPEPMRDRDNPAYWDMVHIITDLPKSNGIIVNTFEELEPIAVKAIADGVCVPKGKISPVYYIGPLTANEKPDQVSQCLIWLDKQPSRSVLFLCFGSRGKFSIAQLKEIADSLERSGKRFLWVVKKPPLDERKHANELGEDFDLDAVLPEGFLSRTKDRGLVVKSWAPQVAVLKREAVGGFVTHCGWNSVLESVIAGVPMIAWPLYAEQHLNRNVLVEDMKMAVSVKQREGDGFVSGDDFERKVRELMDSESGREIKERSWKMREMAGIALGESGSSTRALRKLAQLWSKS